MFICSKDGYLKQWSFKDENEYKCWGKIYDGFPVCLLSISKDGQYLLTISFFSRLIKWRITGQQIVFDFTMFDSKNLFSPAKIIAVNSDWTYLFKIRTCDNGEGCLEQWSIEDGSLLKNWGRVTTKFIRSAYVTANNNY